ncbi:MAG: HAD-IB family hydrolase [Actinomycetota bacterium]|nr:HAD-IB family hydrolase [Actinomycetota bacterium]
MRAAFFDLDKTVIAKASIAAFGRPFRRGGLISRRTVVRAVVGQLVFLQFGASEQKLARIRESMLVLTRGWERDRVASIVRETLSDTIEPIIYREALDLMEEHRRAGHLVYLVSAAPEEIVQPLAELLGVDGSVASRAEVDAEGRYTGRMAFYAFGPAKASAVRRLAEQEGIDLALSTAYSDSATDLPMLESVGHPVAVNPDRSLARTAKGRGWEVREFSNPVRLRDRAAVRTSVFTTVAAVAVAGWVLWRGHRARARTSGARSPGRTRGGRAQVIAARPDA